MYRPPLSAVQWRSPRRLAGEDGQLLLPRIDYFQVVFTLPEELSALMLGNRRVTYGLLFRAAWEALGEVLREELDCEPAALMVLHTWNQRLEHHPHLHALVPGGGPSRDGRRWVGADTAIIMAASDPTWSTTKC